MTKSIRLPKEAIVLRDDILELYTSLRDQLKIKFSLIDTLYTGELEKINLIKTGAYHEIEDAFINDEQIIADINTADFEIARLTDIICSRRGIDRNNFPDLFKTETHTVIKEASDMNDGINKRIEKLLKEKENLIINLKKEMDETKKNINALSDISRIKKNF